MTRHLCSAHQHWTVGTVHGPVHTDNATACPSIQATERTNQARSPEQIAETARRDEDRARP